LSAFLTFLAAWREFLRMICFAFFAFLLLLIPAAFSLSCALLGSKTENLVRRGRYITIHPYSTCTISKSIWMWHIALPTCTVYMYLPTYLPGTRYAWMSSEVTSERLEAEFHSFSCPHMRYCTANGGGIINELQYALIASEDFQA
jgi:hypothetical protein